MRGTEKWSQEGRETEGQTPGRAYHRNPEALKFFNLFLLYTVKALPLGLPDQCFIPIGVETGRELQAPGRGYNAPAAKPNHSDHLTDPYSGSATSLVACFFLTSLLMVSNIFL